MTHVLLVEDDADIAPVLVRALEREGYEVTAETTGAACLARVAADPIDVVILDLGLPDADGLDICRTLRERGYQGAILILTARDGELDRVVGLDVGADDYIAKPFSFSELLARIRAMMRRGWAVPEGGGTTAAPGLTAPVPEPEEDDASLLVDPRSRRAFVAAHELHLTAKEFDVLALLDSERGAVVSRERLMEEVWDENWFGSTKTLDATVGRLRQKLESGGSPLVISTVRGVGFRLEEHA